MAEYLRSMISLLTITRGGTTVRWANWMESIHCHGEQYEPHPFMFVFDEWDSLITRKRVEIYFTRSVLAAAFPASLPGGAPITASVCVVTEHERERILQRFDGVLTLDENRVYFEPTSKPSASPCR